jgi:hypothetical protein
MAKKKTAKKVAKKKTASKSAPKKAAKPTKKVAKKVEKKSADKKTAKVTKKKTASKASAPAKKAVKKKTATKVSEKKVAKKVAKKTVSKAAPKAAKSPAKKVAAKAEKKVTKKVTKKVEKKAEKQVAPKTEKKTASTKVAAAKPGKASKAAAKTPKSKKGSKKEGLDIDVIAIESDEDEEDDFTASTSGRIDDDIFIDEEDLLPTIKEEDQIRDHLSEEFTALSEDFSLKDIFEAVRLLDFFTVDSDECIEKNCDNPATTLGYCRYHYIRNWKDIKKKQSILMEGKLQDYIEDLAVKYPPKYIEAIINDLAEDKAFMGVLKELNIESDDDEAFDDDADDDQDIAYETKQTVKTSFIDD